MEALRLPGITDKQRVKLRNKISAQKARVAKRKETADLTAEVEQLKAQNMMLMDTITTFVQACDRERIVEELEIRMPHDCAIFDILKGASAQTNKQPGVKS